MKFTALVLNMGMFHNIGGQDLHIYVLGSRASERQPRLPRRPRAPSSTRRLCDSGTQRVRGLEVGTMPKICQDGLILG